ncbi:MAG: ECF transporter S component [Clostridia bacterium]|nr:ECF transporter S component [Clostridia bacterium]
MNNAKFFTSRNVALLGILIALVVILQLFASAIPMLGVTINFSLIPIAFAGIMLGWLGGLIVGFSSGLVVFITAAVMGQEPSTAFLFQTNPVVLTLICIGKTTLAGAVAGLIFKLLENKNKILAVTLSSIILPVINTLVYMLGMVIMKESVATFLSLESSSAGLVFAVVFGIIWLNFILEIVVTAIFTPLIHRVVVALKI